VHILVEDEGQGLANPENIFVPFYTTKPEGTGIGLVLCRQIIEAHGGHLSIANRLSHNGCRVTIELPLTGFQSI
jgi:signal transduction histidine kinase